MWRIGRRLPQRLPSPRYFFSTKTAAAATAAAGGGGDPIPEIPTLYSFLQPSIFALRRSPKSPLPPSPPPSPKTLTPEAEVASSSASSQSALESSLLTAVRDRSTDDAWRAFKSLASRSLLPSLPAAAALLSHLASLRDRHSLKRAFAAALFLLERDSNSVTHDALAAILRAMDAAAAPAPALALVRAALRNRFFPPFAVWGLCLAGICRKNDCFTSFLRLFEESCRLALEEGIDAMKPDMDACNEVLDGCCRELMSVADAERLVETMSALGLSPDSRSFGSLAFLYASQGLEDRLDELDMLMDSLGLEDKTMFFKNLISGYIKAENFTSVSTAILRSLKERKDTGSGAVDEVTYVDVVKGFVENGRIKDLAALVIEAQEVESSQQPMDVNMSVGFKIVEACVGLGLLDKAHSMVDEMNARGAAVGLGVYSSILKAYCKEQRTAEAAQLVMEISASGLQLDASSYDALIDASMTAQDFQSAFSLFRDMREARLPNLKTSYLTIMTGLMENHRPELMASFMDTIVDDPNIEIATHDWNSIIHAFCKVGRLEDARRTYRRMVYLRYEPNNQTYLSLINGYVSAEKYFSVLMLWTEIRRKGLVQFDHDLVDAFLYALVKGGFFDAAMQVVEKAQELKVFVDKWRHKQAFMENHKKLKVSKLRRRNFRKMEALVAFKNWAGLNA